MMEYSFGELAPQVTEARHGELLAMAERERRGATGRVCPARWSWRVLATFGARLLAGVATRCNGSSAHTAHLNMGIDPVQLQ